MLLRHIPGPMPRVLCEQAVVQTARPGMTPAQAMIAFGACALCRRVLPSSANNGRIAKP